MATEESSKRPLIIRLLVLGGLLLLFIIGIILCCTETIVSKIHEEKYMATCTNFENGDICNQFTPGQKPNINTCSCHHKFVLKEDLKGAVTLYYELESFDQTNSTYARSRDDSQLSGNPGLTPAASCGNYSYHAGKPIFPCGEVADSLFNDTFTSMKLEIGEGMGNQYEGIINRYNASVDRSEELSIPVPVVRDNLFATDTPTFKNPPADLLNNFTSPINWQKDSETGKPLQHWEFKTKLKGVENPAFQAWMDTSLKRKPVWRVDPNGTFSEGLPAGNYSMFILIHYGVNRYDGVRKIVFEGVYSETAMRRGFGIAFIVLSLIGLIGGAVYMYKFEKDFVTSTYKVYFGSETEAAANRNIVDSEKICEASTLPKTAETLSTQRNVAAMPANADTNQPLL